jgi:PAB1-binding protein PBP1
MVQGKKPNDMLNGGAKYRDQQPNMSFQRKDQAGASTGKNDGRPQNGATDWSERASSKLTLPGTASPFRTDSAISAGRNQGERTLQRWVPDTPEEIYGSLESSRTKSSAGAWDQFAENERRFGLTTDYDENIYTTTIDKSHPQYKQRLAEADKKAREIERSATNNAHVAEERITDNISTNDHVDEEDK